MWAVSGGTEIPSQSTVDKERATPKSITVTYSAMARSNLYILYSRASSRFFFYIQPNKKISFVKYVPTIGLRYNIGYFLFFFCFFK